jgi:hypothetical protein
MGALPQIVSVQNLGTSYPSGKAGARAKKRRQFAGAFLSWRGGEPLLGKSREPRCDLNAIAYGLVVTARVDPFNDTR